MGLLKSTVVSVGLLTGLAATGYAQSVSMLPPEAGTTAQTARSPISGSTQSFFPKPGGSQVIKQESYRPQAQSSPDRVPRPYSSGVAGPRAN
jgi:hypothetical protein